MSMIEYLPIFLVPIMERFHTCVGVCIEIQLVAWPIEIPDHPGGRYLEGLVFVYIKRERSGRPIKQFAF